MLRAVGRQVAFKVAEVHHVHLVKACAEERTHGVAVGVLHHKQLAARGKVVVRDAHAAHIAVQVHGVAEALVVAIEAVGFLKILPVIRNFACVVVLRVVEIECIGVVVQHVFARNVGKVAREVRGRFREAVERRGRYTCRFAELFIRVKRAERCPVGIGIKINVFVVVQVQRIVNIHRGDACGKRIVDRHGVLTLGSFLIVIAHALRHAEFRVIRDDHAVHLCAGKLACTVIQRFGVGGRHAVAAVEHFKALVIVDENARGHVALRAVVIDRRRCRLRRGGRLCGGGRCRLCRCGGFRCGLRRRCGGSG